MKILVIGGTFIGRIADSNTVGDTVRLPPVQVQPEAADDVAAALADVHARYFDAELDDHSLIPGDNPRIAPTRFADWLSQSTARRSSS